MTPETKDLLTVSLSALSIATNVAMFAYLRRIDTRKASEASIKAAEAKADERHRKVLEDIEAMEERLTPRISKLELDMQAAIGLDTIRELYEKINHWAEETSRFGGELSELRSTLRSLLQRVIERGLS